MRKQRKMEYESPQVAEIDLLLTDFMDDARASELKNFNRVEGSLNLTDYDDEWYTNN